MSLTQTIHKILALQLSRSLRVLATTLLENELFINAPISQRQVQEAEGGGLLNPSARFAQTDFNAVLFAPGTAQLQPHSLICSL